MISKVRRNNEREGHNHTLETKKVRKRTKVGATKHGVFCHQKDLSKGFSVIKKTLSKGFCHQKDFKQGFFCHQVDLRWFFKQPTLV